MVPNCVIKKRRKKSHFLINIFMQYYFFSVQIFKQELGVYIDYGCSFIYVFSVSFSLDCIYFVVIICVSDPYSYPQVESSQFAKKCRSMDKGRYLLYFDSVTDTMFSEYLRLYVIQAFVFSFSLTISFKTLVLTPCLSFFSF